MSTRMTRFVILCTATMFLGPLAAAGTLRVGPPSFQGSDVTVPILLEGATEQGVSALDFRLNYDPEIFQPVSASTGAAASDANKQVQANSTRDGEYAVVMMGMNQSTVADGEVASIRLERVSEPASGRSNVRISRTTLASADGAEIPSEGGTATIELNGEEPNGDGPADAEETETAESTAQPGQEQPDSASQGPGAGPQEQQPATQDDAQRAAPPIRGRAQPPEGEEPFPGEDEPYSAAEQLARTLDGANDTRAEIRDPVEPSLSEGRSGEPGPQRQSHDIMEGAGEDEVERTAPRVRDGAGETESRPGRSGALTEMERLAQADPGERSSESQTEAGRGMPAATTGSQADGSGGPARYVIGTVVVLALAALFVVRNKLLA